MIFPGNLILPAENLGCDCVQSSTLVLVRSCFFLNLLGIRGCFFSVLVRQSKSYSTGAKNLQFTV